MILFDHRELGQITTVTDSTTRANRLFLEDPDARERLAGIEDLNPVRAAHQRLGAGGNPAEMRTDVECGTLPCQQGHEWTIDDQQYTALDHWMAIREPVDHLTIRIQLREDRGHRSSSTDHTRLTRSYHRTTPHDRWIEQHPGSIVSRSILLKGGADPLLQREKRLFQGPESIQILAVMAGHCCAPSCRTQNPTGSVTTSGPESTSCNKETPLRC